MVMTHTRHQQEDYFVVNSVFIPIPSKGRKKIKEFMRKLSEDQFYETIFPKSRPFYWSYRLAGYEILEEVKEPIDSFARLTTLRIMAHKHKGVNMYLRILELKEPQKRDCDDCSIGSLLVKFGKDKDLVECFSTEKICRECISFEIARRVLSSFSQKMRAESINLLRFSNVIHQNYCENGKTSERYQQILGDLVDDLRRI